ncbi:MAG: hypothetical protein JST83_03385 [Bacteroidetes bacterium]|nr:hypothetical protein [Bacteroidota bacterium]
MNYTIPHYLYSLAILIIPTVFIGMGMYMIVRAFIRRDQDLRLLELRMATNKETRLLKLQAYERMALFLERVAPAAVISRVMDPDMVNHELQLAIIRNIRSEFEHNLSQQIYISSDAWNLIVSAKDELIKATGMIAQQISPDTAAPQVARIILESIANSGQMLPTQTALEFLKNEARELL